MELRQITSNFTSPCALQTLKKFHFALQGYGIIPSVRGDAVKWLCGGLAKFRDEKVSLSVLDLLLQSLILLLNDHCALSPEEYKALGGKGGSLIMTLENPAVPYSSKTEACQCLYYMTNLAYETAAEGRPPEEVFPPEVTASVQRIIIKVLQEHKDSRELTGNDNYLRLCSVGFTVLCNLIASCPNEVLKTVVLCAAYPFVYFGIPEGSKSEVAQEALLVPPCVIDSSDFDTDEPVKIYTNRNRKKRLRRKRARNPPPAFGSPLNLDLKYSKNERVIRFCPPSADSLSSISLKPEWVTSRRPAAGECAATRERDGIQMSAGERETNLSVVHPPSLKDNEDEIHRPESCKSESAENLKSGLREVSHVSHVKMHSGSAVDVRIAALHAIKTVIDKVGRQNKFSFWPQLMCQNPSLMTLVLKDPCPDVRMAALQVITTFLTDSAQVLRMAVDSKGTGSFTSLGWQLGQSLGELHRCLRLALLSEKFPGNLVRILKAIELLVQNICYSKLMPGLLTKIVTHIKYFMKYKEHIVRANAFAVMVSILMIKPHIQEVKDILLRFLTPAPAEVLQCSSVKFFSADEEEELTGDDTEEQSVPFTVSSDEEEPVPMVSWLLQRCLESFTPKGSEEVSGMYVQVQLQSLKVLGALLTEQLSLVWDSLPVFQHIILLCCEGAHKSLGCSTSMTQEESDTVPSSEQDSDVLSLSDTVIVAEHAYILLGSLLCSVKVSLAQSDSSFSVQHDDAVHLWMWALQVPLCTFFQEVEQIRASVCNGDLSDKAESLSIETSGHRQDFKATRNCGAYTPSKHVIAAATVFTHLSAQIMSDLGEAWQNKIRMTLLTLLECGNLEMQLAGIRIVAVIIGFPAFQGNLKSGWIVRLCILSALQILELRSKSVNKDRLLASWALANISSNLGTYIKASHGKEDYIWDEGLWKRLIVCGIAACEDKDKIKPHAVRFIGNLISVLPVQMAKDGEALQLMESAVHTILHCATTGGNMKMRWNACHALGNILASSHSALDSPTKGQIICRLCSLVESFPNYKVQIQACSSLCTFTDRVSYGNYYELAWKSLIKGLDNAQNVFDCREVNHRDLLIQQICIGLCQLTCTLDLESAGSLFETFHLYFDVIKPIVEKAQKSILPEKGAYFLKASEHIQALLAGDSLSEEQEQTLRLLAGLFSV